MFFPEEKLLHIRLFPHAMLQQLQMVLMVLFVNHGDGPSTGNFFDGHQNCEEHIPANSSTS